MIASTTTRCIISQLVLVTLIVCIQSRILAQTKNSGKDAKPFKGLIIDPDLVTPTDIDAWKKEGFHAIVLVLDERYDAAVYQKATKAIVAKGLDLYYWIEVGRNPTFAKDHTEWMESLGSHSAW